MTELSTNSSQNTGVKCDRMPFIDRPGKFKTQHYKD